MSRRRLLQQAFGLTLVVLLLAGCGGAPPTSTPTPTPVTGVLVGVQVSFSLDDAADQVLEAVDFAGVVVVELDDGTRVDAVCDEELWSQLQGGQRLEITPIEGSDYWKAVRIVD